MRKIFVSSVIRDFSAFREAAKKAIQLMGDVPVMSEEFGARPYSSERACLTEIDQSDIYLLIMGTQFGYEPTRGVSVTQQEFRHAKAANKPILVFVQRTEMEERQAAFLKEVEDFKSGFYRAQFMSSEDLKDEVIKSIRQLAVRSNAISEDEFVECVTCAVRACDGYRQNSAIMWVAFLPQPMVRADLSAAEGKLDQIFHNLCASGLAKMREGYEAVETHEAVGIRFAKSGLFLFENGLKLLFAPPTPLTSARSAFVDWYVSPSRIASIAQAAYPFFNAIGGWCQLRLSGVRNAVMKEYTASPANSFSMPTRSDDECAIQELLIPCTQGAYESWIPLAIKRMERRLRTS